jgi:hypothetical protein
MIRLDYSLSPSWQVPVGIAAAEADEWALRYEYFLGDVIFMVFEVDMSAKWGWVPVLDFALSLDSIVDALAVGERAEGLFEFTESDAAISFRRLADAVEIEASYVPGLATISYAHLELAAKAFLHRVLKDLTSDYPQLVSNPFIVRVLTRSS